MRVINLCMVLISIEIFAVFKPFFVRRKLFKHIVVCLFSFCQIGYVYKFTYGPQQYLWCLTYYWKVKPKFSGQDNLHNVAIFVFLKSFNSYLFRNNYFKNREMVLMSVALLNKFFFFLMNSFFSHYFLWMNIQMHFRVRSQLKEFFPWSCLAFPRNTSLSSNWFSYQGL